MKNRKGSEKSRLPAISVYAAQIPAQSIIAPARMPPKIMTGVLAIRQSETPFTSFSGPTRS